MITEGYLVKIGLEASDIDFIMQLNKKHMADVEMLVSEYIAGLKIKPFVPYEGNEWELSNERTKAFIKRVQDMMPEENKYSAALVAWVNCVPYLYDIYKRYNIDENVFYESINDFSYKVNECKNLYGVCGVFTNWFFSFFDLKLFSLGRLQYQPFGFEYDNYTCGDVNIIKNDVVYYCHIPSGGKLTIEMCMESFHKAYEFFRPKIFGDVIPIICSSWLLYKPYVECVFPQQSNMLKFAELFDIIDSISNDKDFKPCWRVFNKRFDGTTNGLPADNTLRRNFIKYINDGGDFGTGYGVALYDGKKRKIINL